MQSDAELFAAASQGDQHAFAVLVHRHRRWAELYAIKCGAGSEAADVAQEAFLKLLRSKDKELRSDSLRSLLSVDIHFQVLRLLQKQARQMQLEGGSAIPDQETGLSQVARRRRLAARVVEAMERLRSTERRLLELRHVEGLRPVEIAERTGRTDAAIRAALFRARRALRLELGLSS
ncbi:hypothetical protein PPSIR1_38109 [Plesiocystis pacifica SIR-1]|uniref:RNA polymerase sigma factor 70 region 4 type 2 domain-containing protein n=1 Tax=Plesiocystis pacifica SIR-1 TaxID=391625 RepID=A6GBQ1_9BACT|nr:sigma-70 family RNA polymerase sigma factor [Plesiocystis pacifica]EDM76668.1 hypothetical protein PPSIR1_38109 [Plesiocystis pacifica SIR-1]